MPEDRIVEMTRPTASILVPSVGNQLAVERLRKNIANAGIPRTDLEVCVLQNGVPPEGIDWPSSGADRLCVWRENRGFARAANHLLDMGSGQFLALLDDDVALPTDWLSDILDIFRGLEMGGQRPGVGTYRIEGVEGVLRHSDSPLGKLAWREVPFFEGVRVLSRASFHELGYITEGYWSSWHCDKDLSVRASVAKMCIFSPVSARPAIRSFGSTAEFVAPKNLVDNCARYVATQRYRVNQGEVGLTGDA